MSPLWELMGHFSTNKTFGDGRSGECFVMMSKQQSQMITLLKYVSIKGHDQTMTMMVVKIIK